MKIMKNYLCSMFNFSHENIPTTPVAMDREHQLGLRNNVVDVVETSFFEPYNPCQSFQSGLQCNFIPDADVGRLFQENIFNLKIFSLKTFQDHEWSGCCGAKRKSNLLFHISIERRTVNFELITEAHSKIYTSTQRRVIMAIKLCESIHFHHLRLGVSSAD